jgi:hypothetical protein
MRLAQKAFAIKKGRAASTIRSILASQSPE